ncbi:hypothetical protein SEA_GOURDTHYMES_97 [Gordonia phage GourdThymes]|nr:hypothetical protein SEA_GOURDTHYMES_97 [Gordonia phage GourdThymes]WGH19779.1 hypothetical protein [Gordonia phage Lizzo]
MSNVNLTKKVNLRKRQPRIDYTKRVGNKVNYKKG